MPDQENRQTNYILHWYLFKFWDDDQSKHTSIKLFLQTFIGPAVHCSYSAVEPDAGAMSAEQRTVPGSYKLEP